MVPRTSRWWRQAVTESVVATASKHSSLVTWESYFKAMQAAFEHGVISAKYVSDCRCVFACAGVLLPN